jgi:hypothetical protein
MAPTALSSSRPFTEQYAMANIGVVLAVLVILASVLAFTLVPKTR